MTQKRKLKQAEKANRYRKEMAEWLETATDDVIIGHNSLTLLGAFTAFALAGGLLMAVEFGGPTIVKKTKEAMKNVKNMRSIGLEKKIEECDNTVKFEDIQNS